MITMLREILKLQPETKFTGPITGLVNYGFQNYKIYVDLSSMKEKHVEGAQYLRQQPLKSR